MAEDVPQSSSSEVHTPRISERPGSNPKTSPATSSSQVDQRNMEFATLPSAHFGPLGMGHSPFDIRHISNPLPDYASRYHQSQYPHHVTQAAMVDPLFAHSSFPGQQFLNHPPNQFSSQYTHVLASQYKEMSGSGINTSLNPAEMRASTSQLYQQQRPFYTGTMSQQNQYPTFPGSHQMPYGQQSMSPYSSRTSIGYQMQGMHSQLNSGPSQFPPSLPVLERKISESSSSTPSALRGPPRKPKQSGHALWVGNLPPGAQITDLKDHFSRDATEDIESVFLISKSNCAFVNYKTEEACASAMTRFHDSRFRGVRLVCRLRRGSSAVASPTQSLLEPDASKSNTHSGTTDEVTLATSTAALSLGTSSATTPRSSPGKLAKEKFFIVKSLTVEDLERSLISGIWATQAHNEENLNLAYETAENVYLIFSANKSGEYFGFARMESPISAVAAGTEELETEPMPTQTTQSTGVANVPITIPTPATNTAPRGHIVDDSARGTIFWEAENTDSSPDNVLDAAAGDSGDVSGDEGATSESAVMPTTFGKPFRISWQSTERLPFHRTRGLRNPWNANREVKIARDGTELEPSVGRKLLGMFEQQSQLNAAARAGPLPQYGGYPQQVPQYMGPGMVSHMPYGYGPPGPGQSYGRPY